MVATRDIANGDVILIEKELYSQPRGYSPEVLQRPDVAPLMATVTKFASSHGHLTGPDKYPAEARKAMDQLAELNASVRVMQSPHIQEIWQLHDSFHCAQVGDNVMVEGLVSEKGKKLNGKHGVVVSHDEQDSGRLGVEIKATDSKVARMSIKTCNLKTLGGIYRTNSFGSNDDEEVLFKNTCRINHACGNAANAIRLLIQGKSYVLARKDIPVGEEILIDYIPGEEGDRLGLLQMKYNFTCRCSEH